MSDELPTDPDELRAYVNKLRSLFRLWANSHGTTPEESFRRAAALMKQIRQMLGEPTAEDEIIALQALNEAEGAKHG